MLPKAGQTEASIISIIHALVVATGIATQPTPSQPLRPQYRECPGGVRLGLDEQCPQSGPHPIIIYFEVNKATLSDRARQNLDLLIEFARHLLSERLPVRALIFEGHADRSGSEEYNLALSRRRAEAVRNYLISQGYPPDGLTVRAFGESQPAVATADGIRDGDNRRVQISNLSGH